MADTGVLNNIVEASGFPLQIAIKNLVESNSDLPEGWRVLDEEHAWRNENSNTDGFIDIVICNSCDTTFLVLECKRVLNSHWIFLCPSNNVEELSSARAWVTRKVAGKSQNKFFDWAEVSTEPVTSQSAFCVVAGQDNKSRPMLERVAADLVAATEALAFEQVIFLKNDRDDFRLYFSIIVTTAELRICKFDPGKISLKDGRPLEAQFMPVPYIRFRKQLSVNKDPSKFLTRLDYDGFLKEKENTVFVVNANHFLDFLKTFKVSNISTIQFR